MCSSRQLIVNSFYVYTFSCYGICLNIKDDNDEEILLSISPGIIEIVLRSRLLIMCTITSIYVLTFDANRPWSLGLIGII